MCTVHAVNIQVMARLGADREKRSTAGVCVCLCVLLPWMPHLTTILCIFACFYLPFREHGNGLKWPTILNGRVAITSTHQNVHSHENNNNKLHTGIFMFKIPSTLTRRHVAYVNNGALFTFLFSSQFVDFFPLCHFWVEVANQKVWTFESISHTQD